MITTDSFLQHFASQFDETPAETITPETRFRDLEEWSSLLALSIIAMADEEFNVRLTGDDIRKSETVQDIYNLIIQKS